MPFLTLRSSVRALALAVVLGAPLQLVACAAAATADPADPTGAEAPASAASNLDTSGCSGEDRTLQAGPVELSASRPPTSSCWNIASAGLTVTYSWTQTNESAPQRSNVGFWTSLNGAGTFTKATAYRCSDAPADGYSPNTSGSLSYRCSASATVDFGHAPDLLRAAYGANGGRNPWSVEVAVSLDDGSWDSLDGANYRFGL